MARRKASLEINQFTGGLNTEQNILSGDSNSTKGELNMFLNLDGSRTKRKGATFVSPEIDTTVAYNPYLSVGASSFIWRNADNNPNANLFVQQVGNTLQILVYNTSLETYEVLFDEVFDVSTYSNQFTFSVIDSFLVVGNGLADIGIYSYDGSIVTKSTDRLKIRDFFGVQAIVSSVDLTSPNNLQIRPASLTNQHIYNLRNSTYGIPRQQNNTETLSDPITAFYLDTTNTKYPSNTDSIIPYLYPDTSDTDNRTVDRFFSKNLVANPNGSSESPKGHFIIDALARGVSRLERVDAIEAVYATQFTTHTVSSLPVDTTAGGPRVVTDYAGRFWFAGFQGSVTAGDSKSPNLDSYVLFSQTVLNKEDITQCYQEADPTSHVDPDIVDTDGGFIKLDGAFNIQKMDEVDGDLFVFSDKGVWVISGAEELFSATAYKAYKLFDQGCISANSVVIAENMIFFWSENAIYKAMRNKYGIWEIVDLSEDKIKTVFNNIAFLQKRMANGFYDPATKLIKWVYNTIETPLTYNEEIHYSLVFESFIPYKTPIIADLLPKIVGLTYDTATVVFDVDEFVTDELGNTLTLNDGVTNLTVPGGSAASSISSDIVYIAITSTTGSIKYRVVKYTNPNFYDWTNVGYEAYIQSQNLSFGDIRSRKQTPYVYVYLRQTETGFNSDFTPIGESSCLLSTQNDWSNDLVSGKWSTPRQVYRHRNMYFPDSVSDTYNTGFELVVTRNRVRGSGKAISYKLESEFGKDMHIYGWAFEVEASEDR